MVEFLIKHCGKQTQPVTPESMSYILGRLEFIKDSDGKTIHNSTGLWDLEIKFASNEIKSNQVDDAKVDSFI
jgi:hypothetical protein